MTKGDRIKTKREELGIGQSDLAKKIGISKQSLYKYENNIVTNIPSNIIEQLAKVLETTPSFLMGWEESAEEIIIGFRKYCHTFAEQNQRIAAYLEAFMKLSPEAQNKVLDYMEYQLEKEALADGQS